MTGGLPTRGGYQRVSTLTGTPDIKLLGSTSGSLVVKPAAVASGTITLPAITDTLAGLGTVQTWTAAQTFSAGYLDTVSTSSVVTLTNIGTAVLSTAGAASTAFTLPAPVAGVTKYLYSLGPATVTSSGATIGEAASLFTHINFTATNQAAELHGLSTAKWALISQNSTAITLST